MQGKNPLSVTRNSMIAMVAAICFGLSVPLRAQVSVQIQDGDIIIENSGYSTQHVVPALGKTRSDEWLIVDEAGNAYEACSSSCTQNSSGTWTCRGFETGTGEPSQDYLDMLQYLVDTFGAEVSHDDLLNVDYISFPDENDPVSFFVTILTRESFNGIPIIDYFLLIELNSIGIFDPSYKKLKKAKNPIDFPNDPYYKNQWNIGKSHLDQAQWHPAQVVETVQIGVIDSGIGLSQQNHEGLDGTGIQHEAVAPTSGFPVDHGLSILSLLGDGNSDNDGIVGLLGDNWDENGCFDYPPLLSQAVQLYSYNVGDFGPFSIYVANAIIVAVMQGVDIINLSISMAPSPIISEAIQFALDNNVFVVAAAGNYDPDASWKPSKYPANLDGVISVGAAGKKRRYSQFSANEGVDILAPGEDITVGGSDNEWLYADGTSFAAPHVVAALAMMIAVSPDLTYEEALEALQENVQKRGKDGVGFLDAFDALNHVLPKNERVKKIKIPRNCPGKDEAGFAGLPAWSGEGDYDASRNGNLPEHITLYNNYPNPFNPSTTIRFALPADQHIRLVVYNILGQEVRVLADGYYSQGIHDVRFDAGDLPSGIYLSRMETENATVHRNMVLMK